MISCFSDFWAVSTRGMVIAAVDRAVWAMNRRREMWGFIGTSMCVSGCRGSVGCAPIHATPVLRHGKKRLNTSRRPWCPLQLEGGADALKDVPCWRAHEQRAPGFGEAYAFCPARRPLSAKI